MENLFDIKIEDLRELLQKLPTPVHFSYRKDNGEIREALGTLNECLIPDSKKPKDPSTNYGSNLRYYDLGKEAWRSLTKDCSLINILE